MIDYAEIIRNAGLKATHSRLAVLDALAAMGGHCSADEVFHHLEEHGENVPRGTVFKVVGDLSECGVLMVTDAGPGRTLYEYADVWHHHFVCRKCSRILDVPCVEGRKPCLMPDVEVPAIIEEAQIIFRGVCNDCLNQAPN